jgi:hypothetical protein
MSLPAWIKRITFWVLNRIVVSKRTSSTRRSPHLLTSLTLTKKAVESTEEATNSSVVRVFSNKTLFLKGIASRIIHRLPWTLFLRASIKCPHSMVITTIWSSYSQATFSHNSKFHPPLMPCPRGSTRRNCRLTRKRLGLKIAQYFRWSSHLRRKCPLAVIMDFGRNEKWRS